MSFSHDVYYLKIPLVVPLNPQFNLSNTVCKWKFSRDLYFKKFAGRGLIREI